MLPSHSQPSITIHQSAFRESSHNHVNFTQRQNELSEVSPVSAFARIPTIPSIKPETVKTEEKFHDHSDRIIRQGEYQSSVNVVQPAVSPHNLSYTRFTIAAILSKDKKQSHDPDVVKNVVYHSERTIDDENQVNITENNKDLFVSADDCIDVDVSEDLDVTNNSVQDRGYKFQCKQELNV